MNFVWVVVEDDFLDFFFIKLVVVVVLQMEKGVAAIWLGCHLAIWWATQFPVLLTQCIETLSMVFKSSTPWAATKPQYLQFVVRASWITSTTIFAYEIWWCVDDDKQTQEMSRFFLFPFLLIFNYFFDFFNFFFIYLIYKWLCDIFNFLNSIIIHVACNISVDWVKIDLKDYYCKGVNSSRPKL